MSQPSKDELIVSALVRLGLVPPVKPVDIEKRYRKLAARYHPDNPKTGDPEEFQRLTEAKDLLLESSAIIQQYELRLFRDLRATFEDSSRLLDELTQVRQELTQKERQMAELRDLASAHATRAAITNRILALCLIVLTVSTGVIIFLVSRVPATSESEEGTVIGGEVRVTDLVPVNPIVTPNKVEFAFIAGGGESTIELTARELGSREPRKPAIAFPPGTYLRSNSTTLASLSVDVITVGVTADDIENLTQRPEVIDAFAERARVTNSPAVPPNPVGRNGRTTPTPEVAR